MSRTPLISQGLPLRRAPGVCLLKDAGFPDALRINALRNIIVSPGYNDVLITSPHGEVVGQRLLDGEPLPAVPVAPQEELPARHSPQKV